MHLIVITYDIASAGPSGQKRQRQIAKLCEQYGKRVQHSVFECYIDARQYTALTVSLQKIMHLTEDQVIIYRLGKHYTTKIERFGKTTPLPFDEPFII